jgi:hypothetical protein
MDFRKMIFLGFLMVLFGFLVPFLMVIKVMPASYFWGFLSYAVSVAGLFIGLIGASQYVRIHRKPDNDQDDYLKIKKK